MNDRVLFLGGGDGAARSAVEWVAAHQAGSLVTVMPRADASRPIGRLEHAPFRAPDPIALERATAVAALVAGRAGVREPGGGSTGGPMPGGAPTSSPVVTAAGLAASCGGAPLLVAGTEAFAELVALSAWSMNLPSRPQDTLLARHVDIAARAWPALEATLGSGAAPAAGPALLEALLAGDARRIEAAVRTRRRAARADGPVRFRRLAPRSAGLRPFAVYVDLLPALAAAGDPARVFLRSLDAAAAAALLAMSIALFI
jgi:hypothetical protein